MGWEGERSLTAHFAGSRLCHSRFTPVPYVPFPSHPVPSRLGPFPSVPYPGPDGTGRDEMGRECSDNQIITIIVQFFPAVTNDFLFHSPHVPPPHVTLPSCLGLSVHSCRSPPSLVPRDVTVGNGTRGGKRWKGERLTDRPEDTIRNTKKPTIKSMKNPRSWFMSLVSLPTSLHSLPFTS